MHQRVLGCVAGVVMVLGYEALSASFHAAPALEAPAHVIASDDPVVHLSQGVLGVSGAHVEAGNEGWRIESALFLPDEGEDAGVATCEVIATAACQRADSQHHSEDAGVTAIPSASLACPRPRRG